MKKRAAKIGLIAVEVAAVLVAVGAACAGYFYVRLERGPVDLSMFTTSAEYFVSRNLPEDHQAQIANLSMARGDERGDYVLSIKDLTIYDPADVEIANMPEISFSASLGDLLRGDFGPHTVIAEKPTFRVVRNEEQDVKIEAFSGEARSKKPLRRIFTPLSDGRLLNSAFKGARLNNARITFLDAASQRSWLSENASVEILRTENGLTASIGADIAMDGGTAALNGDALYIDQSGIISLDLQGKNVPIGDLLTMFYGSQAGVLDAPVSGAASIAFNASGDVLSSRFDAKVGAGTMKIGAATGPVKHVEWQTSFDPDKNEFAIERLLFDVNGNSGSVTGAVGIEQVKNTRTPGKILFDLTVGDLVVDAGEFLPEPLPVNEAELSGAYEVPDRKLQIESLGVALFDVSFDGRLGFHAPKITHPTASRSIGVTADIKMNGLLNEAELLRLWPIGVAMGARDWIEDRVSQATYENIAVKMDLAPGSINEDGLIPDDALALSFDVRDVTAYYVKRMTPITGGSGAGLVRGNSFMMHADKGRVGDVALSKGEVEFPVFIPKWQPTYMRFTANGKSEDMLAILDQKPLSLIEKTGLSPDQFQGVAEASVEIMRPNKRDAAPEEYRYSGNATFTEMTVTGLPANAELEDAEGKVDLRARSMTVTADAKLSDAPVNLFWRKNFFKEDGPSDIKFSGTLNSSTGDLFGVPTRQYLRGPVAFSADVVGDFDAFQSAALSADLKDAALTLAPVGWRKSMGAQAKATAKMTFDDGALHLGDINFSGDGADIKGDMTFNTNGSLLTADFERVFLQDSADLSLSASRGANGALKLTAIGDYLNVAPMVETMLSGSANGDDDGFDWGVGVTVNARIDKMGLRNGIEYNVASLDLWHDGEAMQSLSYTAFDHNGPPLTVNFAHKGEMDADRQIIEARTSRIGSLLSGVFGLSSVSGGEGTLLITLAEDDDSDFSGILNARDMRMVEAPLLARVFAAGSLTGLSDLLNGEGIEFDSAYGEFSFKDSVLKVSDARASGPSLGITTQGEVLMGEGGEIALDGAVAPLFQVNSILGNAPIIGDILVGKEGEGIFALSYQISGETASPLVMVNPLSALTPGIFRSIFQTESSVEQVDIEKPDAANTAEQP